MKICSFLGPNPSKSAAFSVEMVSSRASRERSDMSFLGGCCRCTVALLLVPLAVILAATWSRSESWPMVVSFFEHFHWNQREHQANTSFLEQDRGENKAQMAHLDAESMASALLGPRSCLRRRWSLSSSITLQRRQRSRRSLMPQRHPRTGIEAVALFNISLISLFLYLHMSCVIGE